MRSAAYSRAYQPFITVFLYIVIFVTLDRASPVQALPDLGFTLWDPPPASSLALLLIKGFRFAPALFPAAVMADGINGGFSAGVVPTLVMDVIIAAGYAALAAAIRPFVTGAAGFRGVRDVAGFLAVVCAGVLIIGGLVSIALALLQVLPADRLATAVRHFWIGDVTGIVGLFPVLMTARFAYERWKGLPAAFRIADSAAFTLMLLAALWIVFGVVAPKEFQFFYLLLLPMIWVGVRHGLPWCAIAVLIEQIALIAVFVSRRYSQSEFIDFQLLSLAISTTGLLLGAAVTERKLAELGLRQQQSELGRMARLTTAGALGSAIVHEIAQPLATIATYVYACRRHLISTQKEPGFLNETLAKVEAEVLRTHEIVERLREFLASGRVRPAPLNLVELTHRVVDALADEAGSRGVGVFIQAPFNICLVADRLQIEQVLLNLIRNAIEAAAENTTREKQVWVRLRTARDEIRVDVQDNGPGVQRDIAGRLFEPFATAKPSGMGLGLVLSRQIIEFHGGELWCDRDLTVGARFTFRLPVNTPKTHAE